MSPQEQQNLFAAALTETLEKDCSYDVVQAVHEQLRGRIQEHKESRDPEPLAVTAGEVSGVLRNCGVPEERVEAFQTACGQSFGEGALTPANLAWGQAVADIAVNRREKQDDGNVIIGVNPEGAVDRSVGVMFTTTLPPVDRTCHSHPRCRCRLQPAPMGRLGCARRDGAPWICTNTRRASSSPPTASP